MRCRRGLRSGRRREPPLPVVDKLYSGVKTVLQNEAVQKRLIESGYRPGAAAPAEFANFVKTETDKYGKIIKTIGLEKN